MSYASPTPLCLPPGGGPTVRADVAGGAVSADWGALLLRGVDRHHTTLAQAQPATILVTLVKSAVQITQYKGRLLLHLPSACPVQELL